MPDELNQKKRILAVDDEAPLLKALLDKLTIEGFVALGAKDGVEGFETALREHPDGIILDLVMPRMTGLEVLKKLREANDWGRKVPIIILTNLGMDGKILGEVSTNEPSYYLIKSDWKIDDVIEKLKESLGMHF